MSDALTEPAKLLLLAALLTNDKIISNNGKSFLKELILRRDSRVGVLLKKFEVQSAGDSSFLEALHELIMLESQTLYNELFFDTSLEVGKTLSKKERDDKNLAQEKSLIYGEVEYASFYRVLRKINPAPGLTFYDLGSGTGKAVFAARFAYDFSKCVGIEILTSLHAQAESVLDRYNKQFKSLLALGQSQRAMVYEGSFLDFDWTDGDVVFANSTCFDDALMLSLSDAAERLKPGAIVVTFTKGMTNSPGTFELLERKRYRMSWGPATVFIHRRLGQDGAPVGPPTLNTLPSDNVTYDDEVKSEANNGNASSSESDGDGEDEEEDEEDQDYDDDIDTYIKHGFDMDPGNAEEEEEEQEEEQDEQDEVSGGDRGDSESGDDADEEEEEDDEDEDDEDAEEEEDGDDEDGAEGGQRKLSADEQISSIMDKISERRRLISSLVADSGSPVMPPRPVTSSPGSSFSPPRSQEKKQPQQGRSPTDATHSTPEKLPVPPRHEGTRREDATVTIEAPLSVGRSKLTMLSPTLMRSPASSQHGADSPSVQIHSPLDNALLMRKRAAAVNRRVPMSAYPAMVDDE